MNPWQEIADRVFVRRFAFFDQTIGAVVGREGRLHGRGDPDAAVDGAHPRRGLAEPDERHLRWIDDAEYGIDSLVTQIRDRDAGVRHFRTAQRAGARAFDQVAESGHQIWLAGELGTVMLEEIGETAAARRDMAAL